MRERVVCEKIAIPPLLPSLREGHVPTKVWGLGFMVERFEGWV